MNDHLQGFAGRGGLLHGQVGLRCRVAQRTGGLLGALLHTANQPLDFRGGGTGALRQ